MLKFNFRQYPIGNREIEVVHGSITKYHTDALVCPANGDLDIVAIPGGVRYAFLVDGGEEIFLEARKIAQEYEQKTKGLASIEYGLQSRVPPFSAHITGAGRLPTKHVIHSVAVAFNTELGTLYCDKEVVARSTRNVLDLANERGLRSVGFPTLGTGLYQVPMEDAVDAMVDEFVEHLNGKTSLERLGLVLFSRDSYDIAQKICDAKLE